MGLFGELLGELAKGAFYSKWWFNDYKINGLSELEIIDFRCFIGMRLMKSTRAKLSFCWFYKRLIAWL